MMTSHNTWTFQAARPSFAFRLLSAMHSAWRTYRQWYERRAAAHHLAGLDDRMLRDIGISRGEIEWVISAGRSRER